MTIKDIFNNILTEQDNDITLNIPLKDLIWAIVCYSNEMSNLEDEAFSNYPFTPHNKSEEDIEYIIRQKEYTACRRDEIARIIGQYSDFNTQKIWTETNKLFKDYSKKGRLL